MEHIIPRQRLLTEIESCLRASPVTVLLGARQVGKTTLARMVAAGQGEVRVFDLERAAGREALSRTPELTLTDCSGLVVIDEVQRLPFLFEVLRPLCDAPERRAIYLLLGSASPDIVRGVSETLAGRALFVRVPGFSLDEVGADNQDRLWLQGGFPRAYLSEPPFEAGRWLESFVQTFLERDIPQLGIRIPSETLRRFWTMMAHYHGQVWNAAELGRSLSVSPATANHYRDILSGAFAVRVLPPWFENLAKRQIKSPKVYLRDSGLLHWLLGIDSMQALRGHPGYGASWEGYALEQVLAFCGERDNYYWATQRGAELDLMLMRRGRRWGFEFKCSDAPAMTKSMHIALQDLGLERIWVLYPGTDRYPLHERVEALPLRQLERACRELLGQVDKPGKLLR
jgi:hypothetical protein